VLVAGAGWAYWRSLPPTPELPEFRLDHADPEVAQAVETAADVVKQSPRSAAAFRCSGAPQI
jgi:hypothetical protein